jgi:hypothetical protein
LAAVPAGGPRGVVDATGTFAHARGRLPEHLAQHVGETAALLLQLGEDVAQAAALAALHTAQQVFQATAALLARAWQIVGTVAVALGTLAGACSGGIARLRALPAPGELSQQISESAAGITLLLSLSLSAAAHERVEYASGVDHRGVLRCTQVPPRSA